MKRSIATVAIASSLIWCAAAQTKTAGVPRMADGHPDLSGVWWRGSDIGGRPAGAPAGGQAGAGAAKGGGAAKGAAKGTPPPTFAGLYQPWAAAKAKTLSDKDDPSLRCVPAA